MSALPPKATLDAYRAIYSTTSSGNRRHPGGIARPRTHCSERDLTNRSIKIHYSNSLQANVAHFYGQAAPQTGLPATVKRTVGPRRPPNRDLRRREYLTEDEVERLMDAAKSNRWGHRDATMVLVAYRHGLRVSEVADLRWDQIEFRSATLHVRRVKQGTPSTHPILGDELRALFGGFSANSSPNHPSCSHLSVAHPSVLLGLPGWSSARARRPNSLSRRILTCCATPAVTSWPMTAMTHERCKPILGIKTSSIPCAIPN